MVVLPERNTDKILVADSWAAHTHSSYKMNTEQKHYFSSYNFKYTDRYMEMYNINNIKKRK